MPRSSSYRLPCGISTRRSSTGAVSFTAEVTIGYAPQRRRVRRQARDLPGAVAALVAALRQQGHDARAEMLTTAAASQFGGGFYDRIEAATPATGPVLVEAVTEHLRRRHDAGHLQLASYRRGTGLVERYLRGHRLGSLRLSEITTADCAAFFDHLARLTDDDGSPLLGPTPRRSLHGFLSQVFEAAEADGVIPRSPMRTVTRPKKPLAKASAVGRKPGIIPRAVTLAQSIDYDDFLMLLPLMLGLRTSERLGLQHRAFFFEQEQISLHITAQLDRETYPAITEVLKTSAARRRIPLPMTLRPHLDALYLRRILDGLSRDEIDASIPVGSGQRRSASGAVISPMVSDHTTLYTNARGQPVRAQAATRHWAKVRDAHAPDESGWTEHDWRHIAAQILVGAGHSDLVIDGYLGHSTGSRIAGVYAEAGSSDLASAAATLWRSFIRWPEPVAAATPHLPETLTDLGIGTLPALWRPLSHTDMLLDDYRDAVPADADPAEVDAWLRATHGSSLLRLTYAEAWLPPAHRRLWADHAAWVETAHPDWQADLV